MQIPGGYFVRQQDGELKYMAVFCTPQVNQQGLRCGHLKALQQGMMYSLNYVKVSDVHLNLIRLLQ